MDYFVVNSRRPFPCIGETKIVNDKETLILAFLGLSKMNIYHNENKSTFKNLYYGFEK